MKSVDKLRARIYVSTLSKQTREDMERIADEIEREIAEAEAFCRRVEEAARNNDEDGRHIRAHIPIERCPMCGEKLRKEVD